MIFCVWCRPSPLDCYYPLALTTSVNLLPPPILPLHPEQKKAAKHAGRQKQSQTAKLQGQKRTSQSISCHVCLVQNLGALLKPGKPGDVSNVERGEKRLQNRKWSWITEVWRQRGVYLFKKTCLCWIFLWYLCREINRTGTSWQKCKINKNGKLGAGPNQHVQHISSV